MTAHDCDLAGGDVAEHIRASRLLLVTSELPAFYWSVLRSPENRLEQTQVRGLFANFPGNVKNKIQKSARQKYDRAHATAPSTVAASAVVVTVIAIMSSIAATAIGRFFSFVVGKPDALTLLATARPW